MYHYKAKVERVVDDDTIDVIIVLREEYHKDGFKTISGISSGRQTITKLSLKPKN